FVLPRPGNGTLIGAEKMIRKFRLGVSRYVPGRAPAASIVSECFSKRSNP
ncbi:unnamed protein product, partial [Ectocarpus sp. 4 AP-2014]